MEYTGVPRYELGINERPFRADYCASLSFKTKEEMEAAIIFLKQKARGGIKVMGDALRWVRVKKQVTENYAEYHGVEELKC